MNLWTVISMIFITLGLNGEPLAYLSTIKLEDNEGRSGVIIERSVRDNRISLPQRKNNRSLGVKLSAPSAAVMDSASGIILWQKGAKESRSIASITKLMTTLVFLEHNPGWDQIVTMQASDETGASVPNILRGQSASIRDLFYTALIASDNNAIRALVRATGLTDEEFVRLMNKKAQALNLMNTNFAELTGLDLQNTSTALAVLELAKIAFVQPEIKQAVSRPSYIFSDSDGQEHKILSTNNLFGSYLNIRAAKTGYIESAGYSLVLEVAGSGQQTILTVVLGSASNEDRFRDAKILSGWTLENFNWL